MAQFCKGMLSRYSVLGLFVSAFLLLGCSATIEVKYPGSCDFETADLCDYVQGERDDFDWRRRAGPTPSQETGPSADHTLGDNGTGYYMYIEGTGVHSWSAAHLISPSLAPLDNYCVSFFYHMYGEHSGQLNLLLLDESMPEKPGEVVWTRLWEQGNEWQNASVNVACEYGCKLSFEAKPGNGFWSDTAIDDVTVVNGSCYPQGYQTTAPPSTTDVNVDASTESDANSPPKGPGYKTDASQQTPKPGSPASTTMSYQIIEYKYDERFITIILAVGLTFWTFVFGAIFVLFCLCDRRPNGGRGSQGPIYSVQMELSHPDKKHAFNTDTYVEIDEQEPEEIEQADDYHHGTGDGRRTPAPDDRTDFENGGGSDTCSMDSEKYSVPVIAAPKPPRGPSPPCGYMSLQLDSLNNNDEYQPLNAIDIPEIRA